ncbi:MAG: hypothetical protein GTN37_01425 [Candidatus Aenigmarchaeota archaeon]|nr:hypothetical protein [Candidatus Aenigmarchaeota archaeon]NIS73072.1 hypothetical protein [Candidatus Aenigmarchaeota archaeon]
MSFEDMFLEIAGINKIKTYNFVLYMPRYDKKWDGDEMPDTTIANIEVPSDYLRRKSLIDIGLQLNSAVINYFGFHDLSTGILGIPSNDFTEEHDSELKITFPCYVSDQDRYAISYTCFGIRSLCVNKDNELKHMKHVDFGICSDHLENEKDRNEIYDKIMGDLKEIRTGEGWFVHSGASFHYHGKNTLKIREWSEYMNTLKKQAKKDNTTLDKKWPEIQMEKNESILRVEASIEKPKPKILGDIKEQPTLFD